MFVSVPLRNTFVERVFSNLEKIWEDDLNRHLVETIKAELVALFKLKYSCEHFFKICTELSATRSTMPNDNILCILSCFDSQLFVFH